MNPELHVFVFVNETDLFPQTAVKMTFCKGTLVILFTVRALFAKLCFAIP